METPAALATSRIVARPLVVPAPVAMNRELNHKFRKRLRQNAQITVENSSARSWKCPNSALDAAVTIC